MTTSEAQTTVNVPVSGGGDALLNALAVQGPVWFALAFGADRVVVDVAPGDYYGLVLSFTMPLPKEVVIRADAPIYANPEDYCDSPIVRIMPNPNGTSNLRNWIHTDHNLDVTIEGLTFEGWNHLNTPPYTSAFNIDAIEVGPDVFEGCSPTIRHCGFHNNDFSDPSNFFQISGAILSGPDCHPHIHDCCFRDNFGYSIGAIWIYGIPGTSSQTTRQPGDPSYYSDFEIANCIFKRNYTSFDGGAGGAINLTGTLGVIRDCQFIENVAGHGGGAIYGRFTQDTVIENCYFEDNGLTTDPAVLSVMLYDGRTEIGGAIYMNRGVDADEGTVIHGNVFVDNHAGKAGAVCTLNGDIFVTNNIFDGNQVASTAAATATASALGIRVKETDSGEDPGQKQIQAMVVNNLFVGNEVVGGPTSSSDDNASTVRIFSHEITTSPGDWSVSAIVANNTFTENGDRGISLVELAGTMVSGAVDNNVFVDNGQSVANPLAGFAGLEVYLSPALGGLADSDADNNIGEQLSGPLAKPTNFALQPNDPLFVDSSNGDFSLAAGSPAINAGTNFFWQYLFGFIQQVPGIDLAGNARIFGQNVDIGCYEAQ